MNVKAPPATVGRTVHYRLTASDAEKINRRRTDGASIRDRMQQKPPAWPAGAQAHIGNTAYAGQVVPLIVTRDAINRFVNGQVLLDGNDQLWVTDVPEGTDDGTWCWPPRV